jgi:hypothetical protein
VVKIKNIEFTKENFVDLLEWQVEQAFWRLGIPKEERKAIIQDLSEEMRKRIFSLSLNQLPALYKIVNRNLEEKHILLYFHNEDLERYILEKNWGGEVRTGFGDYLMIVDANMASLKTDPVVKRSINYDLKFKNQKLWGKLTITYDHQGKFTWKTTRYRTYLRVYLPEGSVLRGSVILNEAKRGEGSRGISEDISKQIETTQELGKTVFGTFISIEPGEKKSLIFEYNLPEKIIRQIENNQYYLLAQKQPGTKAHRLNLNLEFPYPLKSASPAERREEWGDSRYRLETDLRVDREFKINLKSGE